MRRIDLADAVARGARIGSPLGAAVRSFVRAWAVLMRCGAFGAVRLWGRFG